jgi:hypothetical protein
MSVEQHFLSPFLTDPFKKILGEILASIFAKNFFWVVTFGLDNITRQSKIFFVLGNNFPTEKYFSNLEQIPAEIQEGYLQEEFRKIEKEARKHKVVVTACEELDFLYYSKPKKEYAYAGYRHPQSLHAPRPPPQSLQKK